jgi:4-amino-4-deoxy-L-arabinose transferase-like glycosyltransferase
VGKWSETLNSGEKKAVLLTKGEVMLLAGLLLLASVLRLYLLGVVPPGLHVDEAHNGLDALRILDGARPVFLERNNGREVLYSYIQAPLVALFGPTVWALRLASALIGIATVPLTYLLIRSLPLRHPRATAAAAAFLLATSFWHVHSSRYGIRSILLPLVLIPTFHFLWRGAQSKRWLDFGLSGFFLGLCLYTHPAGRFAPLVPMAFIAHLIWADRPSARQYLIGLGVTALVSLMVFLPLGRYFLERPDLLTGHPSRVSIFNPEVNEGDLAGILLKNTQRIAGMFTLRGDSSWYHNLRKRPVFDPPMSWFFLGGMALFLRDLARGGSRMRAVAVFLGSWVFIMLLPSFLTSGPPNFARAIGIMPAVFIIPAEALVALGRWLGGRRGWVTAGLVVGTLAISAAWTVWDYFVVYAHRPEPYDVFGGAGVEKAAVMRTLAQQDQVYLSQLFTRRSVIQYLTAEADLTAFDTTQGLILPTRQRGGDAVYVFDAREEPKAVEAFDQAWSGIMEREEVISSRGEPLLTLFRLPAAFLPDVTALDQMTLKLVPPLSPQQALEAHFAEGLTLLGYSLDEVVEAGAAPELTLFWRARAQVHANYTVFVHVVDEQGRRWGQQDGQPLAASYPTSRWGTDEVILDRRHPTVVRDAPPGRYQVLVGLYLLETGQRLQLESGGGDHVTLPGLEVVSAPWVAER